MIKEFLPYDKVRNNALKIAHKIYTEDHFVPDVLYCSLRGGAYMANVISEYFKIVRKDKHPVLYAALVARSYSGVKSHSKVMIDGWTYPPERLRPGDKVMLVDDIYDSGDTIQALADILLDRGIPREDLKIVVHDYKHFTYKNQHEIIPDYYCRKFEITNPDEDRWIHYMSHELVGLSKEDLEEYYYKDDPELKDVLDAVFANR
ncbi:MAG: phosphoribosyltransferase [Treponema sp.]|uniref:phosphoribosyltransferase n=1 Tax=Treponema sp. TaxID=166 RepID=UPI00298DF71F|nr:phosphoribosyltransferase family protein [Treponema sp.]MCR5386958.1 phosphoribosyltransferase [Treponema sp.]